MQGIGPFTIGQTFKMPPRLDGQGAPNSHQSSVQSSAKGAAGANGGSGGVSPVSSLGLIVQQVWFVVMSAVLVVLMVMVSAAVICLKRRKALIKDQLGHYNGKHITHS